MDKLINKIVHKYSIGIFSAIVLFKVAYKQQKTFLLAAYCYSWNCFQTQNKAKQKNL